MDRLRTLAVVAALVVFLQNGQSQISKGHQILMNRGLQSMGLVTRDNPFNVSTLLSGNFSGVVFEWGKYDPTLLGPAPGIPWNRWVSDPARDGNGDMADMPPVTTPNDETPYMSNLVMLQLGDEHDLNNATIRSNTANWYTAVRANYPNTILYCNNWGGQLSDAAMDAYIQTSNPDMMSMDTYDWTTSIYPGGSPKDLYRFMRQVRAFALGYNKPYNLWTQTYHGSGDVPPRVDPSDSQLRLNYFAGVGFGFTSFMNFTYNHGSTSLFSGPGDQNPTALYASITDVNAKLKKLGPALTRLKARTNYINGYDASMLYYPGQYFNGSGNVTNTPPSADFRVYPTDYTEYFAHNNPDWVSASNSGMFRGITVSNLGTKNNGLRGDVWMMWFKVLDESLDGAGFNDEIYMMIINGLTDPAGTGTDCRQRVTVNYVANAQTSQLLVLNQQTGEVDTITPPLSNGRRLPVFDIDGGEMVLYKFNTGAPFVGGPSSAKSWEVYY